MSIQSACVGETPWSVLRSGEDASVNFSRPTEDGGMVETRFVRRVPERFIVYISSMTGCDKACRFCWLTQTGQTMATLVDEDGMVEQAAAVLSASSFKAEETVHFNFMARGEPLSNPFVGPHLFERLGALARSRGLASRIKISTIMPSDIDVSRLAGFGVEGVPVDIYYSLYRMDQDWRRRWIPKAMAAGAALDALAAYRRETGGRVILHWALIDGENDAVEDASAAVRAAREAGLDFDFNLVRYNPPNGKTREAPPESRAAFVAEMSRHVGGRLREIPRVGFDVAASCGMFLTAA